MNWEMVSSKCIPVLEKHQLKQSWRWFFIDSSNIFFLAEIYKMQLLFGCFHGYSGLIIMKLFLKGREVIDQKEWRMLHNQASLEDYKIICYWGCSLTLMTTCSVQLIHVGKLLRIQKSWKNIILSSRFYIL